DFLISSFVVGVGAQYGLTGLTGGDKVPHNINYSLTVGYRF
ncbi:MAG: PorT family protein, partial [Odoribacter splanchnicus]|nr:PorT family protein [Odoribacter splanchnicus]